MLGDLVDTASDNKRGADALDDDRTGRRRGAGVWLQCLSNNSKPMSVCARTLNRCTRRLQKRSAHALRVPPKLPSEVALCLACPSCDPYSWSCCLLVLRFLKCFLWTRCYPRFCELRVVSVLNALLLFSLVCSISLGGLGLRAHAAGALAWVSRSESDVQHGPLVCIKIFIRNIEQESDLALDAPESTKIELEAFKNVPTDMFLEACARRFADFENRQRPRHSAFHS